MRTKNDRSNLPDQLLMLPSYGGGDVGWLTGFLLEVVNHHISVIEASHQHVRVLEYNKHKIFKLNI